MSNSILDARYPDASVYRLFYLGTDFVSIYLPEHESLFTKKADPLHFTQFQSEEYTYSTTKFDVVFSLDECIHLYSLDLLMLLSNAEDKSDPPDENCSLFTRIQMTFKLQTLHPYPKINWDIKTGLIIVLHSVCVLVLPFTSVGLCSTCDFYLSSGL